MSRPLVVPAALALVLVLSACAGDDRPAAISTVASTPASTTTIASTSTTTTTPTTPPSTTPTTTTTTTTTVAATTSEPGVRPEGFERIPARVVATDGAVCELCLWVAATPEQRARGLMGVTDLGGADGMVFRYDAATDSRFWMRNTPQALSIAFFAADGSFVSATDMEPCLQGSDADCPRYGAAASFTDAIEVPLGGLGELLIGPGSRLELLAGSCPD